MNVQNQEYYSTELMYKSINFDKPNEEKCKVKLFKNDYG